MAAQSRSNGGEPVGRALVARARAQAAVLALEPHHEAFSLVVDLAAEPVGPRWWRGVATLAGLCAAALALSPGFDMFSGAPPAPPAAAVQEFQANPMLSEAQDDSAPPPRPDAAPGEVPKPVIAQTADAVRVQGTVTEGLYWSLRDAGVSPATAADYLHALSTRIDVGSDVEPYDRFDLVIAKGSGQLLFAALHHAIGGSIELLRWNEGGKTDWFDGSAGASQSGGLMAPVNGHITSGFGMRYHPILHYTRFHAGLDFGAPYGTPIVAAANGQVVAAGWSGGYGREVQIAHGGGVVTLYGHMSGIAAQPGEMVRQGQVIGYVGSTGLSTGPHVHFEVRVNGRAVNPLDVRLQSRSAVTPAQVAEFKARVKQMESIGAKA